MNWQCVKACTYDYMCTYNTLKYNLLYDTLHYVFAMVVLYMKEKQTNKIYCHHILTHTVNIVIFKISTWRKLLFFSVWASDQPWYKKIRETFFFFSKYSKCWPFQKKKIECEKSTKKLIFLNEFFCPYCNCDRCCSFVPFRLICKKIQKNSICS